ncbi:MAG: squalene-associated FAD-dependent desaturase, partial [Hyphomicrobiales bacterium]|nr:squalene-associated FAD-dependent desaturase [Hyphomicrobiales bacterium]
NGNHLLLSGNGAAQAYLGKIGARDRLTGPARAKYPFVDLASGECWTLEIGEGAAPWWIFDSARRAPRTRARDYLPALKLLWPRRARTLAETGITSARIYDALLRPFLLAALNNDPAECSAPLAGRVLREAFRGGARSCRPLYAPGGLSNAFVDPALAFIGERGASVGFGRRLRALHFDGRQVVGLEFDAETMDVAPGDVVVLATPPDVAARLVPGLTTPCEFRAIANIHFLTGRASRLAPVTAVLNGATQWIFAVPDRICVTISDAAEWLKTPQEDLAKKVWREVATVTELPEAIPPWRVIRERKATFAPTPEQEKRRPGTATAWRNLFVAGDWTDTGLPATIEGAIRSGRSAARMALGMEQSA